MKKTNDKKTILKRIKKTLALLTIANYLALMNLINLLITSGTAAKIWNFITVIY